MKIYYLRYCWYQSFKKTYFTYRNNCDKPLGMSKLFWGHSMHNVPAILDER